MKQTRWIFWHRRDLRLSDNIGLSQAAKITKSLIGLYILDPKILNPTKNEMPISSARIWFIANSLLELHRSWEKTGSRLLILKGDPQDIIPRLTKSIIAEGIVWNKNIEPYEIERDEAIESKLNKDGIKILKYWDQLLVDPVKIKNLNGNNYKVFGPFAKKWKDKINLEVLYQRSLVTKIKKKSLANLNNREISGLEKYGFKMETNYPLKTISELLRGNRFNNSNFCPCQPGELAAKKQLQNFIQHGSITQYKIGRDLPFKDNTSKLSAALNIGTLSCRQAWEEAESYKGKVTTNDENESINIWIKELAWREFYQNVLFHFPKIASGPFQEKWKNFSWPNNSNWFNSWKNGMTGLPIIDASMRQLRQSGWMHNRCRMIVASFLVKDLLCNWQWGESAFMEYLVDGDLASNNGGWQWTASSGLDTKPLRIFNPHTQANKFDQKAQYIRYWLPELSHVSSKDLISGDIIPIERKGYPSPLINHTIQQRIFKGLYSKLKK